MTLGEAFEVTWHDIFDTPFIHDAWCDVPGVDQVSNPLRRVGVMLVVIRQAHQLPQVLSEVRVGCDSFQLFAG